MVIIIKNHHGYTNTNTNSNILYYNSISAYNTSSSTALVYSTLVPTVVSNYFELLINKITELNPIYCSVCTITITIETI